MSEYSLPKPVAVTVIGELKISTVHLGSFHLGLPYETGVFATESGEGEILGQWATVEEALKNHMFVVHDKITNLLVFHDKITNLLKL
jgi:hypothetical protein